MTSGKYLCSFCNREFDDIASKRAHERWCSYEEQEDEDGEGDNLQVSPVPDD